MTDTENIDTVNIVCLKWGDAYGAQYVNHLYNMVKRNLSLPFRFICLTEQREGVSSEVEVFPLPEFEEPPWEYARYCSAWRKIALFKPGLAGMQGKVLFLDLDIVITKPIDGLFYYSEKLTIIENWYQKDQLSGQASAFCFEAGEPAALLNHYLENPIRVLEKYQTEQEYITRELGENGFEFFPENWCQSFKKHCMPKGLKRFFSSKVNQPHDAKIIIFHGRPNPPDAIQGTWGKSLPWYKRWYKRVPATAWIADYWR